MDKSTNVKAINTSVSVNCSARLHMGFFDLHGGLGRKFGSIGVSLASPAIELTAKSFDKLSITAEAAVPAAMIEKASKLTQQFVEKTNVNAGLQLNIKQTIPEHVGLGSGTQLALAIGSAISKLYDLHLNTTQISALTGRGRRSGIGIAAFDVGGLLIDGGRALDTSVPPLLARYDFPEGWRILLIFEKNCLGIHGEEEIEAFKRLPEFPENLAAHLCRHVLMQAMPALVERDLTAFGRSIQALQTHVGDYFAPAQGGRYASPQVASVLKHLEQTGVACFGQSSWGPTGFAVFENLAEAEKHLQQLKIAFSHTDLSWLICGARNTGASVIVN